MTAPLAHELYIKACAEALEAADISNTDWTAEDDSPRTGSITLAPTATAFTYEEDTAALLWDEERGWSIGWGGPEEPCLDVVVDLFTGELPDPDELVDYVRAALTVKPIHTGNSGKYRDATLDDADFEDRLTSYTAARTEPGNKT